MFNKIFLYVKKASILLKNIAEVSLFLTMFLMVLSIVRRLFFNSPIKGIYDIEGLLFLISISLALAFCSLKDGHVYVDFLVRKFSERGQRILDIIVKALSIIYFTIIGWKIVEYGNEMKEIGSGTLTTHTPTYPFYYAIAVGIFFMVIVLLMQCILDNFEVGDTE